MARSTDKTGLTVPEVRQAMVRLAFFLGHDVDTKLLYAADEIISDLLLESIFGPSRTAPESCRGGGTLGPPWDRMQGGDGSICPDL